MIEEIIHPPVGGFDKQFMIASLQCSSYNRAQAHYHYLVFKVPLRSFSEGGSDAFGLSVPQLSFPRRRESRNSWPGGIYAAVLPDPISNSEVKRGCANDSPAHAGAKVGSCPLTKNSP